ncbi:NAD(P)H-dependent oxidoreductase subunit E [Niveibacterium sp. SC-1]|uniref:NAD(P)H-dependent oxidoreductase subunit E n=1 Tax=Niveibacterium sp. SC-1 TaxID=3135646 RepID=UPI00311E730B
MVSTWLSATLYDIAARYDHDRHALLQMLRAVQAARSCVPEEAIQFFARHLNVPIVEVRGCVEFYSFLHATPRGQYDIYFSDSPTDRMAGSLVAAERLAARLGVEFGVPRPDGRVTLGLTSCTGHCEQAPAGLVNRRVFTRMTEDRVDRMADLIERGVPVEQWPEVWFHVENSIRVSGPTLETHVTPGDALRASLVRGLPQTLDEVEASGLQGRGGAGFPVGRKWRGAYETRGIHYITCNADEGEPGTFKDRILLAGYADELFEGMTIAGLIVGAEKGYLYMRGEYEYMLSGLQEVLASRREAGLLGEDVCGSGQNFDIIIHLGAGAYVCGEQSALLESLEGRRGIPRIRPPSAVKKGLFGQSTVNNNVESFVQAAQIALMGGAWFADLGEEKSRGTKLLSVAGDCTRPGIYELPLGVTVRELLERCGGSHAKAVQVGGAAGRTVGRAEFERHISYADLATGGSIMVFDERRDMVDLARQFAHFFAHESCGFCTPCRVGTQMLQHYADKLASCQGSRHDLAQIRSIGQMVKGYAHCGLGETAPNALLDTLERFPEEYEAHLLPEADFVPDFDLDAAVSEARALTGRDDRLHQLEHGKVEAES